MGLNSLIVCLPVRGGREENLQEVAELGRGDAFGVVHVAERPDGAGREVSAKQLPKEG